MSQLDGQAGLSGIQRRAEAAHGPLTFLIHFV
jgi:signal transduction histidine kinase